MKTVAIDIDSFVAPESISRKLAVCDSYNLSCLIDFQEERFFLSVYFSKKPVARMIFKKEGDILVYQSGKEKNKKYYALYFGLIELIGILKNGEIKTIDLNDINAFTLFWGVPVEFKTIWYN